jgi:hypothetical protein
LTDLYNSGSGRNNYSETEISELKQSLIILNETVKQYEEQLIQAQNHIILLESSKNGDEDSTNFEAEVKYLRETIAKYTEHIEQIDIARGKNE